MNGKPYLRYISAFTADKPCLKCHATQGYKVGDIRGGITISIPMSVPFKEDKDTRKRIAGSYLLLWMMGTTGIVVMSRRRNSDEIGLRDSEDRLNLAMSGANDGLWDWNLVTNEVYYSPRWKSMLGYEPDELKNTIETWKQLVHPDDQGPTLELVRDLVEGRIDKFEVEFRMCHKDGSLRQILSRASLYANEGQARLVGTHVDITERKLAEMELCLKEDRLRRSQQITHTGTWELNLESNALYWSDEIYRIFELEQTGFGADYPAFLEAIHPDDRDMVNTAYQKSLENRTLYSVDHRLLFPDYRVKWVHEECETTFDEAGKPLISLGTVQDITVWRKAEEDRRCLEQQMQQVQKLESLGVLAGGIAHDFNNILMAIIGNADLALMRINKESPAVENLQRIEQAAARAADLAKQMLAYSGKGKFVVENLNLNILLEEMLHMLEVSISKKAVLRLNQHQSLPSVEADGTQMRQIVMNLVINASEAIGDRSGVIAITTGCMDCDQSYLKNVWLEENLTTGLYVYLEIADTGCGMDKETQAKLFDPFFTTKFTGRGLGMSAVLGIVRGHKGAIKVYSELNRGTTFKILLPASDRPADLFNGNSYHDNWKGCGTVLLVDDEETVRGIGKEMLHELGFTTITANDGREAVEVFKNTPAITFVILDLTMPHMDGEQCFRELKQMNPDVKVIMSSGYNQQEVTQKFVGKGLAGFIQKPYKLSVLREAIKTIGSRQ
jgi:PAS domain S-box-containing protein